MALPMSHAHKTVIVGSFLDTPQLFMISRFNPLCHWV